MGILENTEKGQLFISMPRYKSNQRNEENEPVYKDYSDIEIIRISAIRLRRSFGKCFYEKILEAYQKEKEKLKEPVQENVRSR